MTETQIRRRVLDKATSYLGATRGDSRHKEIIDYYNSHPPLARGYKMTYKDQWCACFVSVIGMMVGYGDIILKEVGCGAMINLYQKKGRWIENDAYIPKPADIILYDWDDSGAGDNRGNPDHVGFVVSCDGSNIRVIEGNKGGSSVVGYRDIKVNARTIRGYAVPDYASKVTASKPEATEPKFTQNDFNQMYLTALSQISKEPGSDWSKDDRQWAVDNGLVSGTTDKVVDLNDSNYRWMSRITREQFVAIAHRLAEMIIENYKNHNLN